MGETGADQMRWLLRFSDVELSELAPAALLELGREVLTWKPGEASGIAYSAAFSELLVEVHQRVPMSPQATLSALGGLQQPLRDGLKQLAGGKAWTLPARPDATSIVWARRDAVERLERRATTKSRALVRRYIGSFEAAFYAQAGDVLVAWWPATRLCASKPCRRRFLPVDSRQRYCSTRCSQATRWARFAPTRTRDYAQEYARRVAKRLPGAKVRHRAIR